MPRLGRVGGVGAPQLAPLSAGFQSLVPDGASAVAFVFNTQPLSAGGAKLLSLRNNGTERVFVGVATGTVKLGIVGDGGTAGSLMQMFAWGWMIGAVTGGAVLDSNSGLLVEDDSVGTIPLLVTSTVASKTNAILAVRGTATPGAGGDLQIWQNNTPTTLARIDSAGRLGLGSGLSPSDTLSIKSHAAFAGSEANRVTAAVQTTDATVTTLYSKTLADNTLYWFDASVVGRDAAGTQRAFYVRQVRVHRQGGGVATLGTVQTPVTDETSAGMDATFTVSSNDVRLSVTGVAATTINWACAVWYQGVSGNA